MWQSIQNFTGYKQPTSQPLPPHPHQVCQQHDHCESMNESNHLTWTSNTSNLVQKAQQWLFVQLSHVLMLDFQKMCPEHPKQLHRVLKVPQLITELQLPKLDTKYTREGRGPAADTWTQHILEVTRLSCWGLADGSGPQDHQDHQDHQHDEDQLLFQSCGLHHTTPLLPVPEQNTPQELWQHTPDWVNTTVDCTQTLNPSILRLTFLLYFPLMIFWRQTWFHCFIVHSLSMASPTWWQKQTCFLVFWCSRLKLTASGKPAPRGEFCFKSENITLTFLPLLQYTEFKELIQTKADRSATLNCSRQAIFSQKGPPEASAKATSGHGSPSALDFHNKSILKKNNKKQNK